MRNFVTLAMLIAAPPVAAQETSASNWTIVTKVDPITDETTGSAWVLPLSGAGRLIIACNGLEERTLSVQVTSDDYLGNGIGTVVLRVNKTVLPATEWDLKGRVAFTTNEAWINLLGNALGEGETEIVVRALDFQQQPHDRIYRSKNGAKAFQTMAAVCAPKPKGK